MRPLARVALLATAVAVLSTGCGDDSEPAQAGKADKPAPPISYTEARKQLDLKSVEKGEVTIRNKTDKRIECSIAGYQGGNKFGVDGDSARIVEADRVEGKTIDAVTCADRRAEKLNVTPSSEGADLEYLSDGSFQQRAFVYVHSHLDWRDRGCEGVDPRTYDWATSREGQCIGRFLDGSDPYRNDVPGLNIWQRVGDEEASRFLGPGVKSGYKITQVLRDGGSLRPGTAIQCYISGRASGDCVTDVKQVGKPANSEGGPLQITAEDGDSRSHRFGLIRGWCRKGDPLCTVH